jgi:hypothetical protein
VRRERQVLLGELHALRLLAADGDPLARLLNEGAALHVEARLRLLELAESDAATLAVAARAERSGGTAAAQADDPVAAADA